MKLRYMLGSTDEEFEKRIEAVRKRRERFESGDANDEFVNLEKTDDENTTTAVNRTMVGSEMEAE